MRTFPLALVLAVLSVAAGCARTGPLTPETLPSAVREAFSGDSALETVAFLDQHVRWPGNAGFDASIDHVAERLEAAGYVRDDEGTSGERLAYRVESYPMERPAWQPLGARVEIEGDSAAVLDFATNRNMLATNSHGTPPGGVTAELVDVGPGREADFDGVDVRGRFVMADTDVGRLFRAAVQERGAAGVLGYDMPDYTRPEVNRTSIQFGGIPIDTVAASWGIALSYEARERLRAALAAGPVRLRVETEVEWTADAVERTVVAEIRGSVVPDERFVFSAHVQEPGANDNASGVGAQVEMARVAAELVRRGSIDPGRTLTFLWGDEIRSTARFVRQDSVRAQGIEWGMSLDMVGENTALTGGTFLIEKMPDPSAVWTRGDDRHTEWGGRPLSLEEMTPHFLNDFVLNRALEQASTNGWIVATNPFEGGSDHVPFLRAGIPSVLLWHFTDQFYHTDRDRLEMVSAEELENVGVTALVTALRLVTADGASTRAIAAEVRDAALARLEGEAALSAAEIAAGAEPEGQEAILAAWIDWYDGALSTVAAVEIGGPSTETLAAIGEARDRLRAYAETVRAGLGE